MAQCMNYVVLTMLQVETFVAVVGAGPVRRQIPLWIIILAIVGGCILLLLIIIILWKVRNSFLISVFYLVTFKVNLRTLFVTVSEIVH